MKIISIKEVSKQLLKAFDCGEQSLNDYLIKYALQNDKKNIGKTFVCTEENKIMGFYTLANAQILSKDIDMDLINLFPRYPIPCVMIARFAVDQKYQKKGYGKSLLKDALLRIVNIAEHTGIYFVIVDVKEAAKQFYEHYGFIKLNKTSSTYLLPLSSINKALYSNI